MANVIQSAISAIRNKASEMFNDNKGFIQQGKFTTQPIQQAVSNVGNYFNPNTGSNSFWSGKVGQSLANVQRAIPAPAQQFSQGFGNTTTYGLAEFKPQEMTPAYRVGQVAGFLNPLNPLNKGMAALNVGGRIVSRIAPKAVGLGAKLAGGLLSEGAQTGTYAVASALGNKLGLNEQTGQFKPENLITNLALGSAGRGVLSPQFGSGVGKVIGNKLKMIGQKVEPYVSDFKYVNEALQRLETTSSKQNFDTAEFKKLMDQSKAYNKTYNLMPEQQFLNLGLKERYQLIGEKLKSMVQEGMPPVMGFAQKKSFTGEVGVPKVDPFAGASKEVKAYIDEASKYKTATEFQKAWYAKKFERPKELRDIGPADFFNRVKYIQEPYVPKGIFTEVGKNQYQYSDTNATQRLKIKPKELGIPQTEVKVTTDLQTNLPPVVKQSIKQIDQAKTGLNLEAPPVTSTLGSVPRGFTESVQEAPNIAGQTKAGVTGMYTPKANDVLMGEAKALLESGATIDFKNTQGLDKKVAATIQEAVNQQNAGNHEAAANLFNNLSEHGTELGRSVQAFNLLQKMSPEAIALSAAGKIKKYNLANPRRPIPELNGDQVKMIADKVQAIDLLKGREKNIALNELGNIVNSFTPSTLGDKALAIWKAGLLTSFRTHERNFVGNTIHGTMEVLKDIPATAADIALSGITGKRTTTFTTKGLGEFGSKSTRQQMADIVSKGFDPSETIDKFDYKQITWGKNKIEQGLKKYTDVVFRTLGASDKPFYNASMARSLYDQAGAEAINAGRRGDMSFIENLVKNPTEQMVKNAISDANVATFKTKNAASEVANALKRTLSKNELTKIIGEVTIPFTGVPSSILGQIQAYSPIGLVKGIYKVGDVAINKLPELQRQAVQELGRGVIGTGIFGLGAYLMGKGLITGQPKDSTEARQWELENKPRNSIMIGGKWRSLNSIGPEAVVFLAGAKLKEDMTNPEGGLGQYAMSLGKDYLDQSFVQGLQGPINAITDPMRYGKSYVGQLASSPIPNIVKDASRALDPYARETNTVLDYVKSGIPGLRNTLIEKRDALGNIIPQEPTGIYSFIDLFNSKTPIDNLTVNELARLNSVGSNATPSKMSGTQTLLGNKIKLTFQQLNQLEAGAGQVLKPQLEQLILSPTYQQLDDENKAKAIDKLVTNVRTTFKATNATNIVPSITPSATYKAPAVKKTTTKKLKMKKAKKVKISAPKKIKVKKLTAMKIKKPKRLKLSFKKSKPIRLKIA